MRKLADAIMHKLAETENPADSDTPPAGDKDRVLEQLKFLRANVDGPNRPAVAAILAELDIAAEIVADPERRATLQRRVAARKERMKTELRQTQEYRAAKEALNAYAS